MVTEFATGRINRTAGIVMKTFFRSGKSKIRSIKEDFSRKSYNIYIREAFLTVYQLTR